VWFRNVRLRSPVPGKRLYKPLGAYHQFVLRTITTVSRTAGCFLVLPQSLPAQSGSLGLYLVVDSPQELYAPILPVASQVSSFVQPRLRIGRYARRLPKGIRNELLSRKIRGGSDNLWLDRHQQCAAHRVRQSAQVANGHLADKFVYWQWDDRSEQCLDRCDESPEGYAASVGP